MLHSTTLTVIHPNTAKKRYKSVFEIIVLEVLGGYTNNEKEFLKRS